MADKRLLKASEQGSLSAVQAAIKAGAKVNFQDEVKT